MQEQAVDTGTGTTVAGRKLADVHAVEPIVESGVDTATVIVDEADYGYGIFDHSKIGTRRSERF